MKANAAKSANGTAGSASAHERLRPKKRVMNSTRITGISVPAIAWPSATRSTTRSKKSAQVWPCAASACVIDSRCSPPCTPTISGVPTAPNDTGVDWMIMPNITAASAGNPTATISGPATAAGVPKPEAPSMKQPNSQAIRITWMRRSGLMRANPLRMPAMPPECLSVLSSSSAPKMIHSTCTAMISPSSVAAATRLKLTPHANSAIAAVTT